MPLWYFGGIHSANNRDQRQVRIVGLCKKISEEESTAYFLSRPKNSQIGAWTSPQSSILANRQELQDLEQKMLEKFKDSVIEKPPFWGGFLMEPESIEFWQGRESRLHDRIKYIKRQNGWETVRLAP
jgi:pyridoxamine 5'-phosphate oxidase